MRWLAEARRFSWDCTADSLLVTFCAFSGLSHNPVRPPELQDLWPARSVGRRQAPWKSTRIWHAPRRLPGKIKFCHRLHHTFLYAFFIFCHGASYGFRTILNFFHVPTYSFPSCRAANQSRYVWDCRSGEDHTGPKASKTCVDSRNNQTQQHRRSDDDAHRPHHGAATAFSLLAFASVVTHGVLV